MENDLTVKDYTDLLCDYKELDIENRNYVRLQNEIRKAITECGKISDSKYSSSYSHGIEIDDNIEFSKRIIDLMYYLDNIDFIEAKNDIEHEEEVKKEKDKEDD